MGRVSLPPGGRDFRLPSGLTTGEWLDKWNAMTDPEKMDWLKRDLGARRDFEIVFGPPKRDPLNEFLKGK